MPSWSSQMGGEQPSLSSQTRAQQPLWSCQMGGQHSAWSQTYGPQLSRLSQAGRPQLWWSSQTGGQQPSGSSQTGQQPSWPFRMGAQRPAGPTGIEGRQYGYQRAPGHETLGSLNIGVGYLHGSPSLSGHQTSQIARHHQWQDSQQKFNLPFLVDQWWDSNQMDWQKPESIHQNPLSGRAAISK